MISDLKLAYAMLRKGLDWFLPRNYFIAKASED
jgi:hypothetical protein